MIREEMLARLVAQGTGQGGDLVTLRAIIEEASELGSARALKRVGLQGDGAENDIHDLRELLRAWRDAKRSATRRWPNGWCGWALRCCCWRLFGGWAGASG